MLTIQSIVNITKLSQQEVLGSCIEICHYMGINDSLVIEEDQEILELCLNELKSILGIDDLKIPTKEFVKKRIEDSKNETKKRENIGDPKPYEQRLQPRNKKKRSDSLDKKTNQIANTSVSENITVKVAQREINILSGEYVYNIDRRYALLFNGNKCYLKDKRYYTKIVEKITDNGRIEKHSIKYTIDPILIFNFVGLFPLYPIQESVNLNRLSESEKLMIVSFLNDLKEVNTDSLKIVELRQYLEIKTCFNEMVGSMSDHTSVYNSFLLWLDDKSFSAINNYVKKQRLKNIDCSNWFTLQDGKKTVNKDRLFKIWLS